jgi:vacuolar-type H+-ATPase subunit I/STV1
MKDATAPMRKAISETSAKMLTASSEEQKKNYADQIRGYREAIENEEKRIADDQKLEDKENDLKKAKAAKDARINEIKASRGEAYADTLDRSRPYRWFYGNRKAAEAIRETTDKIKDKGKDKSDTEELAEKLNEMLEKNKGDEKKA